MAFRHASAFTCHLVVVGMLRIQTIEAVMRLHTNLSVDSSSSRTGEVPPNDPRDWLFGAHTLDCKPEVVFDSNLTSVTTRVMLPVFFLMCVGAVVAATANDADSELAHLMEDERSQSLKMRTQGGGSPERLWHVDFARIVAVMCVIYEHSGGMGYSRRNLGFGLWWALPFLFLSSGMGYCMSRSSLSMYILRLVALFVAGCVLNLCADMATGVDWRSDPLNVVFQMFYVFFLVLMALAAYPLRAAIVNTAGSSDKTGIPLHRGGIYVSLIIWGGLTFLGLLHVAMGAPITMTLKDTSFNDYYVPIANKLHIFLLDFCGLMFLCALACARGFKRNGIVGWVMLAFIYVPYILFPWHQECFAQWLGLYTLAMVSYIYPLRGSQLVAKLVQSYWPFLFIFLCLLQMPEMTGRCDMFPPGLYWERFRHALGSCLLTAGFLCGGFKMADPYHVLEWMGWWALYAYVTHVAVFRLLGTPSAPALTLGSIFPFYLYFKCIRSQKKEAQ